MTQPTDFAWKWRDPSHVEAHRAEFSRPIDVVLEELRPLIAATRPLMDPRETAGAAPDGAPPLDDARWVHTDRQLAEPVGHSGLRAVPTDGSRSFWGYRPGRHIPSHLCVGEREPTHSVCIWGWWEPDTFIIHTIYPGTVAPREIHDPEIPLADLPAAIEFWRRHAIITTADGYATQPAS
ncbi:MAG TPA: hypothetical protein VJ932_08765 [Alkalispirochaeta sp.]|nr:hypothetical protein [Alkalispirochaeta sp.]